MNIAIVSRDTEGQVQAHYEIPADKRSFRFWYGEIRRTNRGNILTIRREQQGDVVVNPMPRPFEGVLS